MSLDPMPSPAQMRRLAADRQRARFGRVDPELAPMQVELGPDSPLHGLKDLKPRRNKGRDLEHEEQVSLFTWATAHEPERPLLAWLFAVPNFSGRMGKRTAVHGARLKAEGRKPGVPDVWLPVARGGYHGLVIEMKVRPNTPTHEQRHWLLHLERAGFLARVCYTAEEAQQEIEHYLDGLLTTTDPAP